MKTSQRNVSPERIGKRLLQRFMADVASTKSNSLPREEWDFRDEPAGRLPDWQLVRCYQYEFARECPQIRDAVEGWWKKLNRSDWRLENIFVYANPYNIEHDLLTFLTSFKEFFPAKPFLAIPPTTRQNFLEVSYLVTLGKSVRHLSALPDLEQDYNRVRKLICQGKTEMPLPEGTADDLQQDEKFVPQSVPTMQQFMRQRVSFKVFRIDWGQSDTALGNQFDQWLRKNRPLWQQPREERGKSSTRDWLKQLGAMRLLRVFNAIQAADYTAQFQTDKKGNCKPLYAESSEWTKAKRAAEAGIKGFIRFYVTEGAERNRKTQEETVQLLAAMRGKQKAVKNSV